MTTPTDTASTARRQVDLETLGTVAEQVGEFELAIARMANDPAMDVGQAPELLGKAWAWGRPPRSSTSFSQGVLRTRLARVTSAVTSGAASRAASAMYRQS